MADAERVAHAGPQPAGERHALWIELFFDLVFVVAVARLDEAFSDRPTFTRALVLVGLFVPVWWAWVGVVFYATRFAADRVGFRLLILVEMAASLALAASIPGVFTDHSVEFALSYGAVRLTLVGLYVSSRRDATGPERALITSLSGGFAIGALLWLASAAVPAPARYAVWVVALVVDLGAPLLRGKNLAEVPVDASHLPERFGTFILIVLGEAVATTGQGLTDVSWSTTTGVRVAACFVVACAIWWLYFDRVEERVGALMRRHDARGIFARDVFSYGHFPVVIGITFAAAGAQLSTADDGSTDAGAVALCVGVAVVLCALALIDVALHRGAVAGAVLSRLGAAAGLVVLACVASALPTAAILWAAAALSVLAAVANGRGGAPVAGGP